MNVREFFGKLFGGYVFWNLVAMALVVVALCFGVLACRFYTTTARVIVVHGGERTDLLKKAALLLEEDGLVIMIFDSGYNKKYPADYIRKRPGYGTRSEGGPYGLCNSQLAVVANLCHTRSVDSSSLRAEVKIDGYWLPPVASPTCFR